MDKTQECINAIQEAVINGSEEETYEMVKKAMDMGVELLDILDKGLIEGARVVGDKFGSGEFFLADLMLAGNALSRGMELVRPALIEQKTEQKYQGKVVMATVETDIHDIGKNIVTSLLIAGGFEVVDLGVDVPSSKIIDAAVAENADIIGLSALLTTSRPYLKSVVNLLEERGLRDKFKVIVGGGAVNQDYAEEVGADGYAPDAVKAVELASALIRGQA